MLNLGQCFRRLHDSAQAFVIELVRGSAGSAPAERGSNRDYAVLFSHVLMNGVIGEASERTFSAREEDFDLVGGRMLLDACEDVGGFFVSKHSEFST